MIYASQFFHLSMHFICTSLTNNIAQAIARVQRVNGVINLVHALEVVGHIVVDRQVTRHIGIHELGHVGSEAGIGMRSC